MAVLYLDLDGFKEINNTLGHAAGDALLKMISSRLGSTVREEDTVARVGGDEFVIVLRLSGADHASQVALKVITRCRSLCHRRPAPPRHHRQRRHRSVSRPRRRRRHPDEDADVALYEAKRAGQNAYRIASQ